MYRSEEFGLRNFVVPNCDAFCGAWFCTLGQTFVELIFCTDRKDLKCHPLLPISVTVQLIWRTLVSLWEMQFGSENDWLEVLQWYLTQKLIQMTWGTMLCYNTNG